MKAVKIIAFVLGGLVALLAAVAAYIVATFDANKWKGEIAQLVQKERSRSLKIEGELSLSLFPSVGVQEPLVGVLDVGHQVRVVSPQICQPRQPATRVVELLLQHLDLTGRKL